MYHSKPTKKWYPSLIDLIKQPKLKSYFSSKADKSQRNYFSQNLGRRTGDSIGGLLGGLLGGGIRKGTNTKKNTMRKNKDNKSK